MTSTVTIPEFAVVLILSRQIEDAIAIHEKFASPAPLIVGNISKPDEMKRSIEAELAALHPTVVYLPNSHAKARRDISRMAHTHGALCAVILDEASDIVDPIAEKYDAFYDLKGEDLGAIRLQVVPMPNDLRHIEGPFDFIGDIHGCADELLDLLAKLGHAHVVDGQVRLVAHPEGRKVALVGDLTDRGPKNLTSLRLARQLHSEFDAIVVRGNHDFKLMRWLRGANVRVAAGLARTIEELEEISQDERDLFAEWLDSLQTHYSLDGGKVIIAHAGLAECFHGRGGKAADSFSMFGEKAGPVDDQGIPILNDWAQTYSGKPIVVHGHVVTPTPRVLNNVVSIDTGCVFGGKLTAYRYPEGKFVSVLAKTRYFEGDPSRVLI